MADVINPGTL